MKQLTEHFNEAEFKCTCRGRHCTGLPETGIDPKLPILLEAIRAFFGKTIRILSGYRCPKRNDEVKGAKDSQHKKGTASDIVVPGIPPGVVAKAAEQMLAKLRNSNPEFASIGGGIGTYPGFTHIDVREKPARWNG